MYTIKDSSHISNIQKENYIEFLQNQPSLRFIKSHMPFDLLPTIVNSDCKVSF